MSDYRRARAAGGTYFFTVVTHRRRRILCNDDIRTALRQVVVETRRRHPFHVVAWVLLPDHLHCLWTLPDNDTAFAKRWSAIKKRVRWECGDKWHAQVLTTASRTRKRESTIWQRRYWEHLIRDDEDFRRHFDYIHVNPVKHGLAKSAADWPYSSFHRYAKTRAYPSDWGLASADDAGFGEPV